MEYCCTWKYFGVQYSGILSVLQVFRDPVLLVLLSTRSISAFSTAYACNTRSISGFHTARCRNTRSISGFHTARYCWLEYYSEYITRMLKYFGVQYSEYSEYSKYLDVCTAGTACTRGYVLLILPVLAVFGPSVLFILQVLAVLAPSVLLIVHVLAVFDRQYCWYSEGLAILRPSILRVLPDVLFLPKNKKQ